MNTHTEKTQKTKSHSVARNDTSKQGSSESSFQFTDNRVETTTQRKLAEIAGNSLESTQAAQLKAIADNYSGNAIQMAGLEEEELLQGKFEPVQRIAEEEELLQGKFNTIQKQGLEEEELLQGKFEPIQKKENKTGLPDELKSGIENLSGYALDDVKVNYNSNKPKELNAHAYAQGTDIHIAPGQEKHLPHEAWHVVQQKQGRVKPTMQMKGKVNVNDDEGLEREADVMGAKAANKFETTSNGSNPFSQVNYDLKINNMLGSLHNQAIQAVLNPAVAIGNQDFQQGLIHGTYRPLTNLADMHVDAATLANPHLTSADMLAVMADLHQAMTANFVTTGNLGVLDWRPTGAAVVKLVVELLGESLGGFWNKQAARVQKALRKKIGTPPANRDPNVLSTDIIPEHRSYLKSLQGGNTVSIKPIIPGTATLAEFDQDMLEDSVAGRARLSAYDALLDAGIPTSLRIELNHNQLPAIISVLNRL